MLFCKYTFECISDSIVLLKKYDIYLTEMKKKNSSNFFRIIVNKTLLYLKT